MKLPLIILALSCAIALAAPEKRPARPAPAPKPSPAAKPAASGELDASVRMRIESFFKILKEGNVEDAYLKLFEGSSLAKEQPELFATHVKNTTRAIDTCGKVESASILRVRSAGKTLKEVVCILNCQYRPMRWQFYAYYGEGRWQIVDTDVDMELSSFFESGKSASH